jgi:large subunit ribosomal protein L11
MAEQTVDALVDAGKASAGPPLGPALGPTGLNIGEVISEINKKTAEFSGMSVPVKVIFDPAKKTFRIEVGSPPVSQLIIKELGVKKGSSNPNTEKIGNLAVEQVIKVAKMKIDGMLSYELKNAVKEVVGTCFSMGVLVEGEEPKDALVMIDEGKFDEVIKSGRTTVSAEKKAELAEDLQEAREEIAEELAEQAAEEAKEAEEAAEAAPPTEETPAEEETEEKPSEEEEKPAE